MSQCKSPMSCRLSAKFNIIVEKHIKCIKVVDLWKILRSVISVSG